MRALLIALQFLTRIPVRLDRAPEARELALSFLAYPLIGLLIGALLLVPMKLLQNASPGTVAALTLVLWVMLTGGLHIDGLADCADGWIGGGGDRSRTLRIMKDPRSGSAAIATVATMLICKYSALTELIHRHAAAAVLLAPMIARAVISPLVAFSDVAPESELLAGIREDLPARWAVLAAALSMLITLVFLRATGVTSVIVASFFGLIAIRASRQRLGGLTGDVCGAVIELTETAMLFTGAFFGV